MDRISDSALLRKAFNLGFRLKRLHDRTKTLAKRQKNLSKLNSRFKDEATGREIVDEFRIDVNVKVDMMTSGKYLFNENTVTRCWEEIKKFEEKFLIAQENFTECLIYISDDCQELGCLVQGGVPGQI